MQILKTIVDHGPMHVVEFHGQGGEEILVRLNARSAADDDETLIEIAKVMMLHAAAFDRPVEAGEVPGAEEQRPRREEDPDKRSLSDALTIRDVPKK